MTARRATTLVALTLLAGCARAPVKSRLGVGLDLKAAAELRDGEEDAAAVVLLDETRLFHTFRKGKLRTLLEVHRAVLIRDWRGVSWARVRIPFEERETFEGFSARTILADGTVIPLDPSDIADAQLVQWGGEKRRTWLTRSFTFPRAGAGAVVEHHYVRVLRGWALHWRFEPASDVPVRRAVGMLSTYPGLLIRHTERGFGPPEVVTRKGRKVVTWTLEGARPRADEPLRTPSRRVRPRVEYAAQRVGVLTRRWRMYWDEYETWPIVAQDSVAPLLGKPKSAPADLLQAIDGLGAVEAARHVYRDVQAQVDSRRGVVIAKMGSVTPSDIYDRRYGTTSDRAIVMLATLRDGGARRVAARDARGRLRGPDRGVPDARAARGDAGRSAARGRP